MGRWDFDTAEEYADYMSKKEALPKAAFQYGVKMSEGKKWGIFMSPVSPVFHTAVTVRISLKIQLEWEHPFHIIRCPCWSAERSTFRYGGQYGCHFFRIFKGLVLLTPTFQNRTIGNLNFKMFGSDNVWWYSSPHCGLFEKY